MLVQIHGEDTYIKHGPYSKKPPIRRIQSLGYAVSNPLDTPYRIDLLTLETDIQEKDKNKAKKDKTEHENEKSVKKQSKSKSQQKSQPRQSQSQPREAESEKYNFKGPKPNPKVVKQG
ncbi:hypothetical protein Tco_1062541 [Tanacetum coccineum]